MTNNTKHIESENSGEINSQFLLDYDNSDTYRRRRTRSASPSRDIILDSSINAVQDVLNKRQLQVDYNV